MPSDKPPNQVAPGPATSSSIRTLNNSSASAYHSYKIIRPIHQWNDAAVHAFAGAVAGFVSGVVTCPLDVIKTRLQAQGGFKLPTKHLVGNKQAATDYRGLVGTGKLIWKEEGFRGMYRGLGPMILGYLPTWATYFTVYEKSKLWIAHSNITPHTSLQHVLAAMLAGGSSTLVTNPIWVIKTRLQAQTHTSVRGSSPYLYTSTVDAGRKMWANEGYRAFYSGLAPAMLGLTHVAVQFPLYEYFKEVFTGAGMGKTSAKGGAFGKSAGGDGPTVSSILGVLAASCLSKICATSATYPHEVIRTRLQTQQRPIINGNGNGNGNGSKTGATPTTQPGQIKYRGIIDSAKTVYREEGWRAFYAGMGTNMIKAVPASAMTLLTYELILGEVKAMKDRDGLPADKDRLLD